MLRHLFLFSLLFSLPVFGKTTELTETVWWKNARRLTGESEKVRSQAIQNLRRYPQLDSVLRSELAGAHRFLAFDVIATLKLSGLLDDLMQISAQDKSGFSYLAINSLVNRSNEKEISNLYHDRLSARGTSAAAKVILLDTLIRLNFLLTDRELKELLREGEFPEVRSAALYYLRWILLKQGDLGYLPLLRGLVSQIKLSSQLKMQSLYLVSELTPESRAVAVKGLKDAKFVCPAPLPTALRSVCRLLKRD